MTIHWRIAVSGWPATSPLVRFYVSADDKTPFTLDKEEAEMFSSLVDVQRYVDRLDSNARGPKGSGLRFVIESVRP